MLKSDRQTDRQTDGRTVRYTKGQIHWDRQSCTDAQIEIETDTLGQTVVDRWTDRYRDRYTDQDIQTETDTHKYTP